jgi:hypothetical protein
MRRIPIKRLVPAKILEAYTKTCDRGRRKQRIFNLGKRSGY